MKLDDDIDTDIIIPTQYLALKSIEEMKRFAFSPLRKELAGQICSGDIIVAGKNFGCGSSREQAPEVIAALGIKCVIAKSFARIFFRNGLNNGLLLLECAELYDRCYEGDSVQILLNQYIEHEGTQYPLGKMPLNLISIIEDGGLVQGLKKQNAERRISNDAD